MQYRSIYSKCPFEHKLSPLSSVFSRKAMIPVCQALCNIPPDSSSFTCLLLWLCFNDFETLPWNTFWWLFHLSGSSIFISVIEDIFFMIFDRMTKYHKNSNRIEWNQKQRVFQLIYYYFSMNNFKWLKCKRSCKENRNEHKVRIINTKKKQIKEENTLADCDSIKISAVENELAKLAPKDRRIVNKHQECCLFHRIGYHLVFWPYWNVATGQPTSSKWLIIATFEFGFLYLRRKVRSFSTIGRKTYTTPTFVRH